MAPFYRLAGAAFVFAACVVLPFSQYADVLLRSSDLITDSRPNAESRHTVTFVPANAIPPSGRIRIEFQQLGYTIPAGFSITDLDLAVATSATATYADRTIAASADVTNDGVTIVTGTSGSVTFTLNSSTGIAAGEYVRVELGSHADFGGVGAYGIINADTPGSYFLSLRTFDAFNQPIDAGIAATAVVEAITTSVVTPDEPPTIFNGLPSGTIASGASVIEISFETNEYATCRYATSSDVVYDDMTGTFIAMAGNQLFYRVLSGFTDGSTYAFYIRCSDFYNKKNEDDYVLSFTIEPTPALQTSGSGDEGGIAPNNLPPPGTTGMEGRGGSGDFPDGSLVLFRSTVVLSGYTSPGSTVTLLRDGVVAGTSQTDSAGRFSGEIGGLERGTYTFAAYATDASQRRSALFSSTMSLTQGSLNTISNMYLPPTMEVSATKVEQDEDVRVFGRSIPGSSVEVHVNPQGGGVLGTAKRYVASTTPNGEWSVSFTAAELTRGTQVVRSRAILSDLAESPYSAIVYLGVGEDPDPDFGIRADINKDGKVNLVDFSIMLSFWGTPNADADINADGTINLADFSVMLFYWTG